MTALTPIAAGEDCASKDAGGIDGALRTLATSVDPVEIVKIHGMAEALRYAAERVKLGLEAQNRAAELRLWAERRLGDLLRDRVARGHPRSGENAKFTDTHYNLKTPTCEDTLDSFRTRRPWD